MKTKIKLWLIVAISLILIGCMLFGGAMAMLGWDIKKLSTAKYETNEYEIKEEYESISIDTKSADIVFAKSQGEKTTIVFHEQKKMRHSVKVNDKTLSIELVDTRKWYEHIGINFSVPKITVYLPAGEYGALSVKASTGDIEIPSDFRFEDIDISQSTGDVTCYSSASGDIKIKTSTGDIRIENISAESLDLSVSTGDVTLLGVSCDGDVKIKLSTGKANVENTNCKNFSSNADTGKLFLKNVLAAQEMVIERSTGDVQFDACDAQNIYVNTSTGDVMGTLLSDKIFFARTDTGDVDVPKTSTGGECEISTDTGDIKISIR